MTTKSVLFLSPLLSSFRAAPPVSQKKTVLLIVEDNFSTACKWIQNPENLHEIHQKYCLLNTADLLFCSFDIVFNSSLLKVIYADFNSLQKRQTDSTLAFLAWQLLYAFSVIQVRQFQTQPSSFFNWSHAILTFCK